MVTSSESEVESVQGSVSTAGADLNVEAATASDGRPLAPAVAASASAVPSSTVVSSDTGPADPDAQAEFGSTAASGDDDEDQPAASLVRPYTLTAGRTRSAVYLPLEAPVHTATSIMPGTWPPSDTRARIFALCAEGPSVAEISARLNVPLGVTRVLVGDLVEAGTLRVSATLDDDATAAERRELIGRTLRGLRAL